MPLEAWTLWKQPAQPWIGICLDCGAYWVWRRVALSGTLFVAQVRDRRGERLQDGRVAGVELRGGGQRLGRIEGVAEQSGREAGGAPEPLDEQPGPRVVEVAGLAVAGQHRAGRCDVDCRPVGACDRRRRRAGCRQLLGRQLGGVVAVVLPHAPQARDREAAEQGLDHQVAVAGARVLSGLLEPDDRREAGQRPRRVREPIGVVGVLDVVATDQLGKLRGPEDPRRYRAAVILEVALRARPVERDHPRRAEDGRAAASGRQSSIWALGALGIAPVSVYRARPPRSAAIVLKVGIPR